MSDNKIPKIQICRLLLRNSSTNAVRQRVFALLIAGYSSIMPVWAKSDAPLVFLDRAGDIYKFSADKEFLEYDSWTDEEERTVRADLANINSSSPDLIAALYQQRPELRFAKTRTKGKHLTEQHYPYSAKTSDNEITFSPRYFTFTEEKRRKILYHELIHLLDVANRVSLSKEWATLVNPIISPIRVQIATETIKANKSPKETLPEYLRWPTYYGCTNVVEALADYCEETKYDSFPINQSLSPAIQRFMNPDPKDITFAKDFLEAQSLLTRHQPTKALQNINEALCIHPDSAMAHLKLGLCLLALQKREASLAEVTRAIEILQDATIPPSDPHFEFALKLQAHIYYSLKKWDELKHNYEVRLLYNPNDLSLLKKHMNLCQKLSLLDVAAFDRFEIKYHPLSLANSVIEAGCNDDKLNQEYLEKALNKQQFPDQLERTIFFCWLARKAKTKTESEQFNKIALQCLPPLKADGLDDRAFLLKTKILLELGKKQEAESCADELRKKRPWSTALLVMNIALREADHAPTPETQKMYNELKNVTGKI